MFVCFWLIPFLGGGGSNYVRCIERTMFVCFWLIPFLGGGVLIMLGV